MSPPLNHRRTTVANALEARLSECEAASAATPALRCNDDGDGDGGDDGIGGAPPRALFGDDAPAPLHGGGDGGGGAAFPHRARSAVALELLATLAAHPVFGDARPLLQRLTRALCDALYSDCDVERAMGRFVTW